MKRDD